MIPSVLARQLHQGARDFIEATTLPWFPPPQQCLYFLPDPQGQGSFLPTFMARIPSPMIRHNLFSGQYM